MEDIHKDPPHGGLDPAIDFPDESRPETNLLSHKILTGEEYKQEEIPDKMEPFAFFSLFILAIMAFFLIVFRTYGLHISQEIMYPWYYIIVLLTLHIYLPKIVNYYIVLIGMIIFDFLVLSFPFIFNTHNYFMGMSNCCFLLIYSSIGIIFSWFFFPKISYAD